MIQDIKNICSRKQIKYLTFLFLAMLVAAALEMIGLGSIPIFIMIIIDIDVLVNKFPTFFANSYIKGLNQDYITIYGGIFLILIFLFGASFSFKSIFSSSSTLGTLYIVYLSSICFKSTPDILLASILSLLLIDC